MYMPPKENTAMNYIENFKWQPNTWYRAKLASSRLNPIFDGLVFSGFLSEDKPGNYSAWTPVDFIEENSLSDLHYIKITEELFSTK